jgi:cell division protein FtsB
MEMTKYVTDMVLLGVVGTAAFLVRNAFGDLKTSLAAVNAKLDLLVPANAKLEQRVEHLEQQVKELRDLSRELSEGIIR